MKKGDDRYCRVLHNSIAWFWRRILQCTALVKHGRSYKSLILLLHLLAPQAPDFAPLKSSNLSQNLGNFWKFRQLRGQSAQDDTASQRVTFKIWYFKILNKCKNNFTYHQLYASNDCWTYWASSQAFSLPPINYFYF